MRTINSASFILFTACGTDPTPRTAANGHATHRVAQSKADPPPDVLALTKDSSGSMSEEQTNLRQAAHAGRLAIWDTAEGFIIWDNDVEVFNHNDGNARGAASLLSDDLFSITTSPTGLSPLRTEDVVLLLGAASGRCAAVFSEDGLNLTIVATDEVAWLHAGAGRTLQVNGSGRDTMASGGAEHIAIFNDDADFFTIVADDGDVNVAIIDADESFVTLFGSGRGTAIVSNDELGNWTALDGSGVAIVVIEDNGFICIVDSNDVIFIFDADDIPNLLSPNKNTTEIVDLDDNSNIRFNAHDTIEEEDSGLGNDTGEAEE